MISSLPRRGRHFGVNLGPNISISTNFISPIVCDRSINRNNSISAASLQGTPDDDDAIPIHMEDDNDSDDHAKLESDTDMSDEQYHNANIIHNDASIMSYDAVADNPLGLRRSGRAAFLAVKSASALAALSASASPVGGASSSASHPLRILPRPFPADALTVLSTLSREFCMPSSAYDVQQSERRAAASEHARKGSMIMKRRVTQSRTEDDHNNHNDDNEYDGWNEHQTRRMLADCNRMRVRTIRIKVTRTCMSSSRSR